MTGALLRTGNLKDFHPLGALGSPVYTAATQLRAAIRRQLGPDMADVFAIPRRNEDGDTIDWYAPRPGNVVPWSSATSEEQRSIKASLLEIRERIRQTGSSMREDPSNERKVFGLLLDEVMSFPNDRHLYLVGDRPVLTFWGFREHSAAEGKDTLALLPVGDAAAQPAGEPAEPEKRRFPWWWLLPLLLLTLLLLFLLFRGCEQPRQEPAPEQPGTKQMSSSPVTEVPPSDSRVEPEPPVEPARVEPELRVIPHGQGTLGWQGTGGVSGQGVVERSSAGDELAEPGVVDAESLGETGVADEVLPADGAEQAESPPEPAVGREDQLQGPEEPPASEDPGDAPGEPPAPEDGVSGEPPTDPDAGSPGEPPGGQSVPESQAPQQQPLAIPDEALESGSTEFLNGQWRSSTGLMESDTGRPIELEYEFQNGRGIARVKRSDGTVCAGPVQAAMDNGQLVIDHAADVVCPDRTAYGRSQVKCRVGDNGLADCSGSYATGAGYDVGIRRGGETSAPARVE